MKVLLEYFKPSGKWYASGSYETICKELFEIWQEVRIKKNIKELPGLVKGHGEYIVYVDVPEHRNRHPHLVI